MNHPQSGDYIDIHTHCGKPAAGVFMIDCLMAHEERLPADIRGVQYTYGIHPWFLNENNHEQLISSVEKLASHPCVIAIGEAGFDKLKGPSTDLQRKVFEKQVIIAEAYMKPVIIHCVKAWDELLAANKKLRPEMPWIVHGFRGTPELAKQLLSRGMYLSFWVNFVIRPESSRLLNELPKERIFLETDGADVDIKDIYWKVANDLNVSVEELKNIILKNFREFFRFS
jgi:TatD DNase family protein